MAKRVFLTGFMGAGKSTVGPLLASELGIAFIDLDHRVESRAGLSIAEIFAEKGEVEFRQTEAQVLQSLGESGEAVIALGGGTLLSSENAEFVKKNGVLIYLKAQLDVLFQRMETKQESLRPLFSRDLSRLASLFEERKRGYEMAFFTIETSRLSLKQTVGRILSLLESQE